MLHVDVSARSVLYGLNFMFAIGYMCLAPPELSTPAGSTLGLSILWVLLFIPASFVCWYRPVYKAFRFVLHLLVLLRDMIDMNINL